MSFSYANPASGPSAGGIGWFNFGNLSLTDGQSATGLTGTLSDGTTITFDLSVVNVSGPSRTFNATAVPTWAGTFFGNSNYTGLLGNVALQTNLIFAPTSINLVFSNIVATDALNNPISNFTMVVADAETTNLAESWTATTNGGNWALFATLGNATNNSLVGVGTPSVTWAGTTNAQQNNYVFTTQSPTTVTLNQTTTSTGGGLEAIAVGFATTRVQFKKNVGQRIDPADQFVLNIAGTPNHQATTVGAADGIQTEFAYVYGIPGNSYTVNESMAVGSISSLTDYTRILSAANATPAGTIPPLGALPRTVTVALGDNITYTILNAAPETFTKTVDKAYADIGDALNYTVTINNPNNFTVNNVLFTDATPVGTTYVGNLNVSAPFTGTDPSSGITITSIGPDSFVTVSWSVQVNSVVPITSPITNVGSVVVPDGTSGVTNIAVTNIMHAYVSIMKSADKAYATFGDIVTYTITLQNLGNTSANNVVVTDIIPAGATYVAGSITSTVPITGDPTTTISLNAPLIAGGNAAISFMVKIGNSVPNPNPIANTANVEYDYTVDPAVPNGESATHNSNTVTTQVSKATINITKSADKAIAYIGDTITYNITVKNTGNVPANQVVLTDAIPNGTAYVPGSLTVSVPFTNNPPNGINLTNPVMPGESIAISFAVIVTAMPNPNPIENIATANYSYTVNPNLPDGVTASAKSNVATTIIFRYNYSQQVSDLIQSVALEEAALANIADAEGAKIQKMLSMSEIRTTELLCLNRSVAEMMESITMLENVLKQKLNIVNCQINGNGAGCK